jgi:multiple sugar transport system substrate-binding protein
MKRKFKLLAVVVCLLIAVTALASCGNKSEGGSSGDGSSEPAEEVSISGDVSGDITFWTQDTSTWIEYFDGAIAEFNKEYPDVKVKVEYFPEFADKVNQAYSAGQEPDVMQTWQSITDWAKAGKVAAVPESVFAKEELESLFYESALKNKIYEDKYYGIPTEINVESPTLYVNMDLLEKEGVSLPDGWIENNGPKTWDELYQFAKSLTKKEGDQIVSSGLAYNYAQFEANFLSLIWQYGGDYRDEANLSVKVNTPEGKKAAETILRYCEGPDAISDKGSVRYDVFVQGNAAMCVGAPWYAGSFAVDVPDMNYQCFNMPAWVEGSDPISMGVGGWGYTVSEKCENKAAAWAFVNFLSSADQVGKWALLTGALPSRSDALADIQYDPQVGSVDKAIAITKEILPYTQEDGAYMLTPSTFVYTIVRDQLRQMLDTGDIDTALQAMEDEGNRMIEDNYNR